MSEHLITIGDGGKLTFIHDDQLFGALEEIGPASIRRASNVEPAAGGGWEADCGVTIAGGQPGPVLGPFKTRGEALAAEVAWLNKNLLGAV